MSRFLVWVACFSFLGCVQPATLPSCTNVPDVVERWLMGDNSSQAAFGDAAPYDVDAHEAKWDSLLVGTHPDIEYLGNGKLRSMKYGWKLNVEYDPSVLYENRSHIVIEVTPGLDHLFTNVLQTIYVLDKQTGKVSWKYETTTREGHQIEAYAVLGEVLYFRFFNSENIYCVALE